MDSSIPLHLFEERFSTVSIFHVIIIKEFTNYLSSRDVIIT